MKINHHKFVAAVIGSFALGIGAATILHAQAKPSAYVFAEIDVKDQDGYTKEFLPKARANIKEFGGKYLGGGYNKAISFAGDPPKNRIVLLQFPNMEAAKAFSEKQKPIDKAEESKYINSRRSIAFEAIEQK